MSICPLCNGYGNLNVVCPKCTTNMVDQGKISDYFDDYSPYMDIELMRLEDGIIQNYENSQCVHLIQCPNCQKEESYFVQE